MRRTALTAFLLVTLGLPGGAPASSNAIGDLEARGMDEIAPAEMETLRELVEKGPARLVELQGTLLETLAEVQDLEQKARNAELEALEAEQDVRVEQAAYEFLVEQILASGVASHWSTP
jgi:hypothetical protein